MAPWRQIFRARTRLLAAIPLLAACAPPVMQPASPTEPGSAVTAAQATELPAAPIAAPATLASAMPAGTVAYVAVPDMAGLSDLVAQLAPNVDPAERLAAAVAGRIGLGRRAVEAFVSGVDEAALGLDDERRLVAAVRYRDRATVERLLADAEGLEPGGRSDRGAQRHRLTEEGLQIWWYPDAELLTVGEGEALAAAEIALAGGPSLASSERFETARAGFAGDAAAQIYVDLAALEPPTDGVEVTAPLVARLSLAEGVRLIIGVELGGRGVPSPALHAPAAAFTLPEQLPADTVAYLAYSSRLGGEAKTQTQMLSDWLTRVDPGAVVELTLAAKALGLALAPLLEALGDHGTVGLVVPPRGKITTEDAVWGGTLLVGRQALNDAPAMKRLIDEAAKGLRVSRKIRIEPLRGGFFARGIDEPLGVAVAIRDGQLVMAAGEAGAARRLLAARAATLGDDDAFAQTRSRFSGEHLGLWFDVARSLEALADRSPGDAEELAFLARSATASRAIGGISLRLDPARDDGWRLVTTFHDAASLGVVSAIAVRAFRRYLDRARAARP